MFNAALKSDLVWLTIIGLVNSAVAAYYYLRLVVVMYMYEPQAGETLRLKAAPGLTTALVVTAIVTVWLGVKPGKVLDYANRGAVRLLPAVQQTSNLIR